MMTTSGQNAFSICRGQTHAYSDNMQLRDGPELSFWLLFLIPIIRQSSRYKYARQVRQGFPKVRQKTAENPKMSSRRQNFLPITDIKEGIIIKGNDGNPGPPQVSFLFIYIDTFLTN